MAAFVPSLQRCSGWPGEARLPEWLVEHASSLATHCIPPLVAERSDIATRIARSAMAPRAVDVVGVAMTLFVHVMLGGDGRLCLAMTVWCQPFNALTRNGRLMSMR